ncbi:DUF4352 domain-containing protein [Flindersiella endophytica]
MKRLLWILLGLVLIAGILAAGRFAPTSNQQVAQIITRGKLGETVDTGGFELTVHKVQTTKTLTSADTFGSNGGQVTKDIFLVIDATIVGDWRPVAYDDARLETGGGYEYRASDRFTGGVITEDQIQPGIARRGMLVFELPADRLAGAKLRLGRSVTEDIRLGPAALVDLGLDDAKAAELLKKSPKQIRLPKVRYG